MAVEPCVWCQRRQGALYLLRRTPTGNLDFGSAESAGQISSGHHRHLGDESETGEARQSPRKPSNPPWRRCPSTRTGCGLRCKTSGEALSCNTRKRIGLIKWQPLQSNKSKSHLAPSRSCTTYQLTSRTANLLFLLDPLAAASPPCCASLLVLNH